ncbi:MAG: chloride channel protein [Firmicutes bacterium]|nr:chloride channel protein [Bacillota bacterium]
MHLRTLNERMVLDGGIFLPVLVLGAISGALYINIFDAFGLLHNTYMANFIILAMAGILTSVLRSPILSILLVTEMTGSFQHILSLCIIAITSYLIAELLNNKPIYDSLLGRMLDKNLDQISSNQITLFKTQVTMDSPLISKKIRVLEMPENIMLLSINRHEEDILAKKDTILQIGDVITIMTDEEHLLKAKKFFQTK